MQNYYEILQITATATAAEIQQAFNQRYGEVSPLVNSHDPQKAAQAQQMLRALEEIRDTLLDPKSRRSYDAGVGIGGGVAGLTDLSASPPRAATPPPPPPPPRPKPEAEPVAPTPPKSLWACPKCNTENPPKTPHCMKCGQVLLRMCPECNQIKSLVTTGRCGSCGYDFEIAMQRKEWREEFVNYSQHMEFLHQKRRDKNTLLVWISLNLIGFFIAFLIILSDMRLIGREETWCWIAFIPVMAMIITGLIHPASTTNYISPIPMKFTNINNEITHTKQTLQTLTAQLAQSERERLE